MKISLPTLPWQGRFLESVRERRVVIGGVGSGKSIICADELIFRALSYPHARHYVIGANHPMLKEGTIPTLCERLDVHGFEYDLNRTDLSITITSGPAKGCRIVAWTVEQNKYLKLKSQMIDSCWLDECQVWERGSDAYDFIVNRMRPSEAAQRHHPTLRPRLWMSANPPHTTAHWLYKKFVTGNQAELFHVTTFDNHLLPQRDEYVERLRQTYSPELFAIEVMGEWGDIGTGRVYTGFNRQKHVTAVGPLGPLEYDNNKPLILCHDFGVDPRVAVICQVHNVTAEGWQRQVAVILDEIRIRDGSTLSLIEEFVRRYPKEIVSELHMYGDPSGENRNSTTGQSDWAMLRNDHRLRAYPRVQIIKRPPGTAAPIVDRVNAVNSKLRNARGEIGVLIHPRCEYSADDFQSTKWKEGARQLDHGTPAKGILLTHLSDAFGYFVEYVWPVTPAATRSLGQGLVVR